VAGSDRWKTKRTIILSPNLAQDDSRDARDMVGPGEPATFVAVPQMGGKGGKVVSFVGNVDLKKFPLTKISVNSGVLWSSSEEYRTDVFPVVRDLNPYERLYLTFENQSGKSEPVWRMLPTLLMKMDPKDVTVLVALSPVRERQNKSDFFQIPANDSVSFIGVSERKFAPSRVIIESDKYDGLFVVNLFVGMNSVLHGKGQMLAVAFSPEHSPRFTMEVMPPQMQFEVCLHNFIADEKRVRVTVEGTVEE
jgi:hypothetical protein